ncbi:HIT-like domain-containing protein [Phlyctochytrium arcticum]|nr:HIT-like domain-containing protein [Phlyctochytrium arcticum]
MNPKRPDCISEEAEAVKSLSNLYIEIFRQFAASQGLTFSIETNEPVKRSAFELMRGSAKAAVMSAPKAATPQRSNWNDLLLPYCLNPEKYPNDVLSYDTEIVVVRDKYPKARYHLLLMPRTPIDGFSPLGKEHLPLLDRLHNTGQMVITKLRGTSSETFREGFHAVPSMRQLHMHVISQDLESPSLKHKKHWNSFTTDFFIDFEKFRLQLETNGRIKFDEKKFEELLKSPLRCHRCKLECSNMPKLKEHIGKCTKITS